MPAPYNRISKSYNHNYTTTDNDVVRALEEGAISVGSLGVFLLMWSRPPDWRFFMAELAKACGIGREKLQRHLRELESAGFLVRTARSPSEGGGLTWLLTDYRAENARSSPPARQTENPVDGETPLTGKPDPIQIPDSSQIPDSTPIPNGSPISENAIQAGRYYDRMKELDRLSVTIQKEGREKTVKRWTGQFAEVEQTLGDVFRPFLAALKWAFLQPPGHSARWWWEGSQGRCDSPKAWLKKISGEEMTRAESLVEKHAGELAKKADQDQASRLKKGRTFDAPRADESDDPEFKKLFEGIDGT